MFIIFFLESNESPKGSFEYVEIMILRSFLIMREISGLCKKTFYYSNKYIFWKSLLQKRKLSLLNVRYIKYDFM